MIPPDHDAPERPSGPRHAARRSRVRRLGWPLAALVTAAAVTAAVVRADNRACAADSSGSAVYFDYHSGNCSFPGLPATGLYVGLSPGEYAHAALCGAYLDVRGPDGTVRAQVVDQCAGCRPGELDLTRAAFSHIGPLRRGTVPVSYRLVHDPHPARPLGLYVKPESTAGWLGLLVVDHGNPLAAVRARGEHGEWTSLRHGSDNYWIATGLGPGPYDVRVTDTLGHSADATGVPLRPGRVRRTGAWLYGKPLPSPSPSPSPSEAARPPKPLPRPLDSSRPVC